VPSVNSFGSEKKVALVKASDTSIRRHTQIKGAANLFDPTWEEYFENRFGLKMKDSPRGKIHCSFFGI
jgi:RNA-directed DNA polymerase